jgi:hypothetical protein
MPSAENGALALAFGAQDCSIIGEPGLKEFSLRQGLIWQQELSHSVKPGPQMRPCDPLAALWVKAGCGELVERSGRDTDHPPGKRFCRHDCRQDPVALLQRPDLSARVSPTKRFNMRERASSSKSPAGLARANMLFGA